MVHRQRTYGVFEARQRAQRDHRLCGRVLPRGRANVQHRQRRRVVLEFRIDLHNHLVLIVWHINRRYLPRCVSVPKRLFDLPGPNALGCDPHGCGLVSVNNDLQLRIANLQVAADVPKVGQRS